MFEEVILHICRNDLNRACRSDFSHAVMDSRPENIYNRIKAIFYGAHHAMKDSE